MPDIMIRCATSGRPVRTGLTTQIVIFESIKDDVSMPLRCPACDKVHEWSGKDAWADKGNGDR